MLRSPPQRPVSPANTTFSGISNYRSESYRTRDNAAKGAPSVPTIDARIVAKSHFEELTSFLATHVSKETQGSRTNARDKLTKLTTQQFQELSTDVYDELLRRKNNSSRNEVPFLPVRDDFHPRRNQAREKLATLPQLRFKDLSSDVYYELGRRYPEFKDEISLPATPASPGSAYEESNPPSAQPRSAMPITPERDEMSINEIRRRPSQSDSERPIPPSSYNNNPMPPPFRRPSQDDAAVPNSPYRRPSQNQDQRSSPGGPPSAGIGGGYGPNVNSMSSTATRRPSRGASDRDKDRDTITSPLLSATQGQTPAPTTAKSGIVIPNKSTMAEEDPIDIPFGETPVTGSAPSARSAYSRDRDTDIEESESEYGRSPKSPEQGGGLSGLSARLGASSREPPPVDSDVGGGPAKSSDEYYDKMSLGRTSVASDRSGGASLSRNASKVSDRDRDREDLKREYEFKIATLQTKVGAGEERARVMEEDLRGLRELAEDHVTSMRALQRELDEVTAAREKERRQMEDELEERERDITSWRQKYEQVSEDARLASNDASEDHAQLMDQLRGHTEGLIIELTELQGRNEELLTSKEECDNALRETEEQAKEWKRKYENAKTELRGLKATSQLFLQTPEFEDAQQIPVNSEGGVLDIHLTSFQSAIDSLLTIARSPAPAKVLTPMKTVVDATSAMLDDVRAYERRPPRGADLESVRALYERLEDTLSNLVIAAKNHAQSYGLSPVSLLDAAASHVSTTVVELAKCVHIRRSTKAEQDAFSSPTTPGISTPHNLNLGSPMSPNLSNGFSPKLRSVDELRVRSGSTRQRNGSVGTPLRGEMSSPPLPPPPASAKSSGANSAGLRSANGLPNGPASAKHRHAPSEPSSSSGGSISPPIFDTPLATANSNAVASDESGLPDNPDDVWAELRPYLEAQSEQLVYAIQSVLSAVRAPVPPASLNEHLAQVITIVASIVAVCKDSLPPTASGQTVNQLLRELSENCDKLSELQAQDKTKDTRQAMAKASFAVANAMKLLLRI